jgi:hypothetical protein
MSGFFISYPSYIGLALQRTELRGVIDTFHPFTNFFFHVIG